jgi:hypothetical protein
MMFHTRRRAPSDDTPFPVPASTDVLLRDPAQAESYHLLAENLGWPVDAVVRSLELQRCLGVPAPLAVAQVIAAATYGYGPETMVELLSTILAASASGEMEEFGSFRLSGGQSFYYEAEHPGANPADA